MNDEPSVLNVLAELRHAYRGVRRRDIAWRIYTRGGLLQSGLIWLTTLVAIMSVAGVITTHADAFGIAAGFALASWPFLFEWAQRRAFRDAYNELDRRVLVFERRMQALRYVLFRRRITNHWRDQPQRLAVVADLAEAQRDLQGGLFATIQQHPLPAALLALFSIVFAGWVSQQEFWTSGRGWVALVVLGAILALTILPAWALSGLVLTRAYRDREFCLFLRLAAADWTPSSSQRATVVPRSGLG